MIQRFVIVSCRPLSAHQPGRRDQAIIGDGNWVASSLLRMFSQILSPHPPADLLLH